MRMNLGSTLVLIGVVMFIVSIVFPAVFISNVQGLDITDALTLNTFLITIGYLFGIPFTFGLLLTIVGILELQVTLKTEIALLREEKS